MGNNDNGFFDSGCGSIALLFCIIVDICVILEYLTNILK